MMEREEALLLRHASLALEEDALTSASDLRDRLWVDVAVSADRELWQEQLDAIEVLARLARVDTRAAWTLLLDTPAKQVYVGDLVASRTPMRFRLAVPPEVLANDVACATLQDLLGWGSCDQRYHTLQFSAFRHRVEELSAEDCAVLCIQQGYVPPHVVTRTAVLTRLVALAEAQRAAASRACCGCFQWKWTHVALDSIHIVTVNEVYDLVRTLLDRGVRVARLRISPQAAVVDGTAAGRFWRRSLRANGIGALTLPSSMDFRAFQGICHALATTPIVGIRPSLTFVIDDGAMDLAARVALHFSGLKLPQARVFARFVAALRNRPRATSPPSATDVVDRFAVLRAGANVSVGTTPTASGISTGTVVCVAEATSLRVVDSVSRGFHVGVQWSGAHDVMDTIAWVRNADVVRVGELPPQDDGTSAVLWIDHVKISVTRRLSLDAVALFLSATNAHVRRLTLDRHGSHGTDDTASCSTLLDACASLGRLDLSSVSLTSLDWLLDMNQPRALRQLGVLSLTDVHFKDPERTLPQLIHALANPDHELGRSLCKLDMTWASVEPYLDQFLAMLAANTRLETCTLSIDTDHDPERLDEFRACSFAPRVKRRCCMAFLSVFAHASTVTSKKPIAFLDALALSRVLAFAAVSSHIASEERDPTEWRLGVPRCSVGRRLADVY